MTVVPTASRGLSQRIAAWNRTKSRSFQSVGTRCHATRLRSSLSTKASVDMENPTFEIIEEGTKSERMNLFTAINDALSIALKTDPTSILFGQGKRVIFTVF